MWVSQLSLRFCTKPLPNSSHQLSIGSGVPCSGIISWSSCIAVIERSWLFISPARSWLLKEGDSTSLCSQRLASCLAQRGRSWELCTLVPKGSMHACRTELYQFQDRSASRQSVSHTFLSGVRQQTASEPQLRAPCELRDLQTTGKLCRPSRPHSRHLEKRQ